MIVHLNGWPGVGKATIGRIVASKLGARFVHNHLVHDLAIACTGIDDPERWGLYEQIRSMTYRALAAKHRAEIIVMTNALCTNCVREREAWNHVVDLAMARRAPLVPIVLDADITENERRIVSADRVGRKMTDPALLRAIQQQDTIQRPDVGELLVLDVTNLPAAVAADRIVRHVESVSSARIAPADERCRRLIPESGRPCD